MWGDVCYFTHHLADLRCHVCQPESASASLIAPQVQGFHWQITELHLTVGAYMWGMNGGYLRTSSFIEPILKKAFCCSQFFHLRHFYCTFILVRMTESTPKLADSVVHDLHAQRQRMMSLGKEYWLRSLCREWRKKESTQRAKQIQSLCCICSISSLASQIHSCVALRTKSTWSCLQWDLLSFSNSRFAVRTLH